MSDNSNMTYIERLFNGLELLGIILALFVAFAFQLILKELPCPLCILQRIGLFGIALGFLMNLRFGLRPSHYAISLISAIFTSFVALRQIALHVIPGSGTYGDAIFGLHLYTWSFIAAMLVIVVTTLMMGVDRQYLPKKAKHAMRIPKTTHLLFAILLFLVGLNAITTFMECGFAVCPDNPVNYVL